MNLRWSGAIILSALMLLARPSSAADDLLKGATFCHEVDENQAPKDKAESFQPTDTVYLSVQLKGRPKSGLVSGTFFFRDQPIAEAKVDVATVNKGVLFSFGQSTYVAFNLAPEKPLPVGTAYRTEVKFDGKPLGSFPFKIAPPAGAIPSKVEGVALAKAVDEHRKPVNPAREFGSEEKVYLAGHGDLGVGTWIEADWYFAGAVDPAGTRSLTIKENSKDVPFDFAYVPQEGWAPGPHEVALIMNGAEVAREKFNVTASAPAKVEVTKMTFHHAKANGEPGEETADFSSDDRVLYVQGDLARPARTRGLKIVWVMVHAGERKNLQIDSAVMEEPGLLSGLHSDLTLNRPLPAGEYRVDVMQGDKVIASKGFRVK